MHLHCVLLMFENRAHTYLVTTVIPSCAGEIDNYFDKLKADAILKFDLVCVG